MMLLSAKLKPATVTLPLLPELLGVLPHAVAAIASAARPASSHLGPSLRFIRSSSLARIWASDPTPGSRRFFHLCGLEGGRTPRGRGGEQADAPRHEQALQPREQQLRRQRQGRDEQGTGEKLRVVELREAVDDVPAEAPTRDERGHGGGRDDLDRGRADAGHDQGYRKR